MLLERGGLDDGTLELTAVGHVLQNADDHRLAGELDRAEHAFDQELRAVAAACEPLARGRGRLFQDSGAQSRDALEQRGAQAETLDCRADQ